MRLLDLPLEVLDEIIALTLPDGIEGFSLACKAIYTRATAQIHRHNVLRRRWRHTLVNGGPQASTLRALCEISYDPLVAQYVESLHLRSPSTVINIDNDDVGAQQDLPPQPQPQLLQPNPSAGTLENVHLDEAVMSKVAAMVADSKTLDLAGVDHDEWWAALQNEFTVARAPTDDEYEDSLCTTVSLLDQLPNLESLQLSPAWSDFIPMPNVQEYEVQRLTSVLDALVENANQKPRSGRPLSKLHTILPFMSEGYEERAGLQALIPFLELSSLRELYAVSCIAVDDGYTGIPFRWRSPDKVSSLTRIELAFCCMDADGVSALVSHTPHLQIFRYSHQTKWHGCQHDWNPGTFVEALARHCGKTLIDLALTVDDLYGEVENGASSFHSFPYLQYLEVDVLIFCGPPVESGQRRGMIGTSPSDQAPWTHGDIPCIGSMLPDNVIEVQINTDYPEPDEQALRALLKNIRPQRKERLKKLEKVVIRQQDSNSGQILADEQGVTLDIFGAEGSPRSMMPNWKRQFDRRVGGIHLT